jgi:hypothetical protein
VYSLLEAARAVGRSKAAILKAIKSGRISAGKDALGQWEIDPAELHRVYPVLTGKHQEVLTGKHQEAPETKAMRREIELLRETVADLRAERDRLLTIVERQPLLEDQRPRRWRWWWNRS